MELRDILGMGKDFLLIGIFLTVLLVAIFGIGYLVYRKIGKGKKKRISINCCGGLFLYVIFLW